MKKLQRFSAYCRIALLAFAILASSCRKESGDQGVMDLDSFMDKQEIGLFGYGGFLFKYTPQECQIAVNIKREQIRIQNDTQTGWINMYLAKFPSETGEEIEIELRYMSGGDEIVQSTVMETVKASGNKFWLWNRSNNMGIVIPHCW